MEQNQDKSLFELNLSQDSRTHLKETASWAKFLAICGMIFLVLMVIFGIIVSMSISRVGNQFDQEYRQEGISTTGLGAGMMIMYILMALLYFFPCLFTLQFANKMKLALASNDDLLLSESFRNLKKTFRYMGVLTIIGLAFFLLALLTGGLTALTS